MNIPVLSDMTKQISRDYGVLLEGEGVALRYGAVKASGIVAGRAHGTDAARRLPARACPALPAASSSLTPRACCARSPSTTCRSAAPSTRPSASSRPSSTPTATARVWQCPEGGGHCSVWVRPDTHSPPCLLRPTHSLPGGLEARQRDGAVARYQAHVNGPLALTHPRAVSARWAPADQAGPEGQARVLQECQGRVLKARRGPPQGFVLLWSRMACVCCACVRHACG